jgi:predicted DNA-binding transcriptional regulator YafY
MPDRHEKVAQAIELVLTLAATRYGRSTAELTAQFSCGRRTIERLFAALRQAGLDVEEVPSDSREKRWRIPQSRLLGAVRLSAEEVAEIEAAGKRLARAGYAARANLLAATATKLRAMMDEAARRRAEPDVEALLAAEGLASRPGPRIGLADGVIETLRHALLAARRVRIRYRNAGGDEREHLVEPCGLLYGDRPYLLGLVVGKTEPVTWRLDRVIALEVTAETFVPRAGHDVASLMSNSFGIWRDKPVQVVLRFAPSSAADAANWVFHASQTQERAPDGALLVRFRAGGLREMAFHLATWGEAVEVLEPPTLREELVSLGRLLLRRHGAEATADERLPGHKAA